MDKEQAKEQKNTTLSVQLQDNVTPNTQSHQEMESKGNEQHKTIMTQINQLVFLYQMNQNEMEQLLSVSQQLQQMYLNHQKHKAECEKQGKQISGDLVQQMNKI